MPDKRDQSFSKQYRLRKSNDFKRVFSRGKRIATPYFVLYLLPNRLAFSRLGIQVKAKLGTATKRNYMKRIVREIFRKLKSELVQSVDIILIAEKPLRELRYQELEAELRKALQRYLA